MRIRNPKWLGKPQAAYFFLILFLIAGAKVWTDTTANAAAEKAAHAAAIEAAHRAAEVAATEATAVAQRIAATQLLAGCGRTQRTSAYQRLRAQEFTTGDKAPSTTSTLAPELFPILWCERSYRPGYKGPPVFLSKRDAHCFIDLVRAGYFNQSTGRQPFTDPKHLRPVCIGFGILR